MIQTRVCKAADMTISTFLMQQEPLYPFEIHVENEKSTRNKSE